MFKTKHSLHSPYHKLSQGSWKSLLPCRTPCQLAECANWRHYLLATNSNIFMNSFCAFCQQSSLLQGLSKAIQTCLSLTAVFSKRLTSCHHKKWTTQTPNIKGLITRSGFPPSGKSMSMLDEVTRRQVLGIICSFQELFCWRQSSERLGQSEHVTCPEEEQNKTYATKGCKHRQKDWSDKCTCLFGTICPFLHLNMTVVQHFLASPSSVLDYSSLPSTLSLASWLIQANLYFTAISAGWLLVQFYESHILLKKASLLMLPVLAHIGRSLHEHLNTHRKFPFGHLKVWGFRFKG